MSAARLAVATATKKNVKFLMMVPPSNMLRWTKSAAMMHQNRSADAKQLDDSIGETFGSVDDAGVRRSRAPVTRFASRAEAATVTARQSRLVDRGAQSINSDSSSQSSAESRACSGPNNSFTAPMNDANSRSAKCTWFA